MDLEAGSSVTRDPFDVTDILTVDWCNPIDLMHLTRKVGRMEGGCGKLFFGQLPGHAVVPSEMESMDSAVVHTAEVNVDREI